ncbi:MAG: adenine nucleotide alpha hydrolase [Gammaproteobacteria bacterium]
MTTADTEALVARLSTVLAQCAPAAVAVSGGVDSMTLAHYAHSELDAAVTMYHAVSPAVPAAATARVRRHAATYGWRLEIVGAGEFDDPDYRANPVDRCFYCKTNLYAALARATDAQLLAGTNTDDLGDYRPGLRAAASAGVRHPFVEAGIDKAAVRALARRRALTDLADLPASPCLSSRVETGIRIDPAALAFVDAAEQLVRETLATHTVRCRLRRSGIVIELDQEGLAALDSSEQALREALAALASARGLGARPIDFAAYVMGSAFLRQHA